eukprot:CAMPEP_0197061044 /NCGR_PEP_ID=MMETSP1384-20130603/133000_1 /TAXON_ID=29189 /ORGANISM="Ammonia sp." /LENGTH=337 /DNA_ID=CAMNT_0042496561 /DNA_START=12 /DNA_END=1025 /DNA_ORIENTATION=+
MSRSESSRASQRKQQKVAQQQQQRQQQEQEVLNQRMMQQMQQIQQISNKITQQKMNQKKFTFEYLGIESITRGEIMESFGSIRCILIMGPQSRAEKLASQCVTKLKVSKQYDKIGDSEFFSIYRAGTVLTCSHGMGLSSVCIFLNELLRIMSISQNNEYEIIRLGSSGGIGVSGGTLVVSTHALDPVTMKPEWVYYSCGHEIKQECIFNPQICKRLYTISKAKQFNVEYGKTVSAESYYEGQARLDGALCPYTEKDKMKYLKCLHKNGVRNFEMEGTVLAGICTRNGIKCAMLCVAYLDRLKQDTVPGTFTKKEIDSWMENAIDTLLQYIYQFILKK